ncbi:MarR family winged helix-turn-helix transcriptional regulator [Streptosporangium sp. NPDC048047]|uniref:MarR family winged helix-turn-helix transcriptional regulator n=1 Tax=Streptosporangium sp. NPDC048047 TaxID=3155748 RepID=UPI0034154B68
MTDIPPTLTALTAYLLSRAGKTARGRVAARLGERDLRFWHMSTLAALADFGPHSQRELGARLGIDPSDVVKTLDDLTVAGWAERTRDPDDRRRVRVVITPEGRTALAGMVRDTETLQDELLAPLTARERARLHDLLLKVFDRP